jgi:hypothetical protein
MKKILGFIILMLLLNSCDKKAVICCTNIDIGISIKYINEEGENLFELEMDGLNESNINIYHKINYEWVKYFEGNLDYPKGIRIIEREDGKYLVIFPSIVMVENNYSETKIEFSQTDYDIIKTEIDQNGSNTMVTKVWYNDQLKWEAYQTERMFEIVK